MRPQQCDRGASSDLRAARCRVVWLTVTLPLLSACSGSQSALDPAGLEAQQTADLFWILVAGAAVLWILFFGLFVFVTRIHPHPISRRTANLLIVGGGVIFPTVLLAALLAWTLPLMPAHRTPGDGLEVHITGEQWWWRVRYRDARTGASVTAANELRLPRGRRTDLFLNANLYIHSLWIPALAGKVDMIPGRQTRLTVEPLKTGVFRGQCAEFCGTSHALMAFEAVVMEPGEFEAWLTAQAGPAAEPAGAEAREGFDLFMTHGCGACHAVGGTVARSALGPDLTRFGSRISIAAGTLANTQQNVIAWMRDPERIKPGAKMPGYAFLSDAELRLLAAYLGSLR